MCPLSNFDEEIMALSASPDVPRHRKKDEKNGSGVNAKPRQVKVVITVHTEVSLNLS